jgi:hypothetical protein
MATATYASTTASTPASKNFHNTQYHNKNDAAVDFKYICIKKDCFDVNMIDFSYANLNKNKYVEIIYKSPSVFLEGLFLKTPAIASNDIDIFYKNRQTNNITIKIALNQQEHSLVKRNRFIIRKTKNFLDSFILRLYILLSRILLFRHRFTMIEHGKMKRFRETVFREESTASHFQMKIVFLHLILMRYATQRE